MFFILKPDRTNLTNSLNVSFFVKTSLIILFFDVGISGFGSGSSLFFSKEGLFDFKMLKNIPIIEDTINLEFIKESSAKDYKNIHELETLSKYWINIQSKKNLGFEGDFMFVKTHHALVKIHNA